MNYRKDGQVLENTKNYSMKTKSQRKVKESKSLDNSIHNKNNKTKAQTHRITILKEAQQRGLKTGLVQSGHLMEPGTAVFASSAKSRKDFHEITIQLVYSKVDILLSGGEKYLLPERKIVFEKSLI